MKTTRISMMVAACAAAALLGGCTTTEQGTGLGAATGAGLGAIIGNQMGDRGEGALIGAAAGALFGSQVGMQKERNDLQEERLRVLEQSVGTETVWINNTNGSRTPVTLRPGPGGQWIGPRGEYYSGMPGEGQLLPVYGL